MIETSPTSAELLLGIWSHLSPRRRIQLCLLFIVMFTSAGAELISLGTVLPFLAVLSDPALLWNQVLVRSLAVNVGFTQPNQLLLRLLSYLRLLQY